MRFFSCINMTFLANSWCILPGCYSDYSVIWVICRGKLISVCCFNSRNVLNNYCGDDGALEQLVYSKLDWKVFRKYWIVGKFSIRTIWVGERCTLQQFYLQRFKMFLWYGRIFLEGILEVLWEVRCKVSNACKWCIPDISVLTDKEQPFIMISIFGRVSIWSFIFHFQTQKCLTVKMHVVEDVV